MADQQRWFKLWCSAPSDDGIQSLPPAQRWAWAAFGAYTKLHGTKGLVSVSPTNMALAAEMGVTVKDLIPTLKRLPHVRVSEPDSDHGTVTVTWNNWTKYQEDSTQAERKKRSRAKKREEEIRREVSTKPKLEPRSDLTIAHRSNGEPEQGDYAAVVERLSAKVKGQA
jgi:hypothetical protein